MRISRFVSFLDRRFSFVLAVLAGALTVYVEFIRDKYPHIRYDIVSDASVLDVREKLGKLVILYDGMDIQKEKKSLRVIVFRVSNEGRENILKGHYDERSPLGFKVLNGSLVDAEILTGSNEYLKQNVQINLQRPHSALFSPVILEANESFTVKSIVLHPDGLRPGIQPTGKIAGVREIEKVDSTIGASEAGGLSPTLASSPGAYFVRALFYAAIFFGIIVMVGDAIGWFRERNLERRKVKDVALFKAKHKGPYTDADEFIFAKYVLGGDRYIKYLNEYIFALERERNLESVYAFPSSDMEKMGFVVYTETGWKVDTHVKDTLKAFCDFLKIPSGASVIS